MLHGAYKGDLPIDQEEAYWWDGCHIPRWIDHCRLRDRCLMFLAGRARHGYQSHGHPSIDGGGKSLGDRSSKLLVRTRPDREMVKERTTGIILSVPARDHVPMSTDTSQQGPAEILEELGLQTYEAQCFVALTRMPHATAKELSEVSEVPRTRVYDAID
jgi:hypothetical protein